MKVKSTILGSGEFVEVINGKHERGLYIWFTLNTYEK